MEESQYDQSQAIISDLDHEAQSSEINMFTQLEKKNQEDQEVQKIMKNGPASIGGSSTNIEVNENNLVQ
jgi:hypothetical protein